MISLASFLFKVYYLKLKISFTTASCNLFNLGSGGSTENTSKLLAGRNVFPFTYQLPPNLPTSFEGIDFEVYPNFYLLLFLLPFYK